MDAETSSTLEKVESILGVQRSPLTHEIVEPTKGVDRRSLPENVAARVEGRKEHTTCSSPQLLNNNNDYSNDPVFEAERTDPDRLFEQARTNPPNFSIIREKPEHRIVVYLKAQGLSNKEIAERTGYTNAWVGQVCRQPWFRLKLVQELKEAGIDQVNAVLKASALDSVFTLVDLRDDVTAPKAVRKSCADSLLDRYLGKAVQRVEHDEAQLPHTAEIHELDRQIKEIDKQLESNNGKDI